MLTADVYASSTVFMDDEGPTSFLHGLNNSNDPTSSATKVRLKEEENNVHVSRRAAFGMLESVRPMLA